MNRNKYKILVLSDLKENSEETLRYAINISKEINGALELLCVKKANEVVTTENPLSAMRAVTSEFVKAEHKAKNLIKNIIKDDFFAVKNTIKLGNVKNEIEDYLNISNPDFIILGKKQKRFLNLSGDNITDFVTKKYSTKVFIAEKTTISDVYAALNNKNSKGEIA